MNQPELPLNGPYRDGPGWKREGTSREAARAMKPRAPSIRAQLLTLLRDAALTPDEAAAKLGKSILAVRPRFSEMLAEDPPEIYDTGRTRLNDSGLKATVYRAFP